jgi:hypothetical protein
LWRISKDLPATDAGKAAAKSVAAAAKDKVLADEIQASQEYSALHVQAARVKDSAKTAAFRAALKALSDRHPATRFGKMAATEAQRLTLQAQAAKAA